MCNSSYFLFVWYVCCFLVVVCLLLYFLICCYTNYLLACYCICFMLCCFVIIGAQFLLASELCACFTSSFMVLITFNAMKCLQSTNHLWTWSCTNLLLLMLCSELRFNGHVVKISWGLWQASRIGVVFLLFKVQLITHISIFKNLKEFLLYNFFSYKSKTYSM